MSATSLVEPAATAAGPIELLLGQLRATGIRIPHPAKVRDYVTRYPNLIPVLQQASALTAAEFAGSADLSLELYVDPEIDDQYLTLYVRQATYDQHVIERIEQVSESYADELNASSGWFLITTDFQPPKEKAHEL